LATLDSDGNPNDPAGLTNQLPDNEPYHLLADASVAFSRYDFHVPQ
jgi:hypothetical protein